MSNKDQDDDYPIDEMLTAAREAKNREEAVWAALHILDKHGGYLMLPLDYGSWRPELRSLERRAKARAKKHVNRAKQTPGRPRTRSATHAKHKRQRG